MITTLRFTILHCVCTESDEIHLFQKGSFKTFAHGVLVWVYGMPAPVELGRLFVASRSAEKITIEKYLVGGLEDDFYFSRYWE